MRTTLGPIENVERCPGEIIHVLGPNEVSSIEEMS